MFSILMSLYYKENPLFLQKCLNSIFSQTLMPKEVVLIKDGELTQELDAILEEYLLKHSELRIVPLKQNVGLSQALNIGLQHCSYDLVARMDTDDIAYPDRFEKQVEYMNAHPEIDVLGGYAVKIDEEGNELGLIKVPIGNDKIKRLIWTCPFIHPTVMFRKSKILDVGSYNPKSGFRQDDYELWFRCAEHGLNFANIPAPLLYYRFFSDSVKKNNIKVGWHRFKVGFKGCRKLKCSFIAYVGIMVPLFRSLLPYPLNVHFNKLMEKMNPRNNS